MKMYRAEVKLSFKDEGGFHYEDNQSVSIRAADLGSAHAKMDAHAPKMKYRRDETLLPFKWEIRSVVLQDEVAI